MATCKHCFRKYDDRGVRDGLFSSYPNFEFCSSVCASAKREANEQQSDRESAESQAAEYQQGAFEAQKRAQASQLDKLIRLQKEANRIEEEESEARSLGISRKELLERRAIHQQAAQRELEEQQRVAKIAEEERLSRLEGMTRDEWLTRKSLREKRSSFNLGITYYVVIEILIICVCTAIKTPLIITAAIALIITIPLITKTLD